MSDEIQIDVAIRVTKNGVTNALQKSVSRDFLGTNHISQVQTVGVTVEPLIVGDLGNIAHLAVVNIGETNAVKLSLDDAGVDVFASLNPGDIAYLPLAAGVSAIYASAVASTTDVAVLAVET